MIEQSTEQEIIAKGKTAPRITPDDIKANIASEHYFTAFEGAINAFWADAPSIPEDMPDGQAEEMLDAYEATAPKQDSSLGLLTFCVLVLRNGFTVTGESACASPENFDAEIGRKIARENAVQKIWPLMGYELKSKLNGEAA